MRLNGVLILHEQQSQKAAFCKESFVFTCLTYRIVQRFWNGPVYKFYGLQASQMNKVCASSHEYPHVEKKIRIFMNKISKVRQCVFPENIHTPTTEGIGNSEEEGGGQRPRKFQRGRGLYDRFSFQRSFDSIRISKILSYLLSRTFT